MSDSFATPWTVAHQAPLSIEFSRQGYWSGLPLPPPGDLPDRGIKPASPELAGRFFTPEPHQQVGTLQRVFFFRGCHLKISAIKLYNWLSPVRDDCPTKVPRCHRSTGPVEPAVCAGHGEGAQGHGCGWVPGPWGKQKGCRAASC